VKEQGSLFLTTNKCLCFTCAGLLALFGMVLSAGKGYAEEVGAESVFPFESEIVLSNPCAIFNDPQIDDPNIIRIVYGEDIDFDLKGQSQAIIDVDDLGNVHLKFQVTTHGAGIGQTSGIKYQFKSKVMVKSNVNGYDPLGLDPLDEGFVYTGSFVADARIIGQGSAGDADGVAQGAQDNAELKFKLGLHYANGEVRNSTSEFTLQCMASPWANLMNNKAANTKKPVGRGFGDVWNKYAWSMKDFAGGMVVGTKNAFYDVTEVLNPSEAVQECLDSNFYQVTPIHSQIACMELFAAPNSQYPAAADTRFAEIWRFDYAKKTWTKVFDEGNVTGSSQGFRYMETHNGKLYVGSDLGAFITGVDLYDGGQYDWSFPGSQLLVSTDGKNFTRVESCDGPYTPCNSTTGADNPYGLIGTGPDYTGAVNTSIRAMASYKGELYVGTFNVSGGQLWAYQEGRTSGPEWRFVHSFQPVPMGPGTLPKPAVAELRVAGDTLYIGVAGPAGNSYLYRYNGLGTSVEVVPGQPFLNPQTNMGNLKLFTSSKGLLYVGNVDLDVGFYLQVYDPEEGTFREISDNGFFNPYNAYAWSMAEINGRVFVGTFNQDFLTNLPRGEAELWYSDDSFNWQQMALPLDWGPWNYGIRTMEVGNKMLFLGAASNMAAPDLITKPVPLSPGTEVWTIRSTVVAPTGKKKK
jgi:hypothetical protein